MRLNLFAVILCLLSVNAIAQTQSPLFQDRQSIPGSKRQFYTNGGQVVSNSKYANLTSGTPYFRDTWMAGAIKTKDGTVYSGLRLKIDLIENIVIYLDEENREMQTAVPAVQASLKDTVNANGETYVFTHSSAIGGGETMNKWFQVLASGNVSLYRLYQKDILETKSYGSTIPEQSVKTEEKYYVSFGGKLDRVKKIKDIADAVGDSRIEPLLKANKFSDKKEADWVKAVEQINALP